jgi:hypothetical protein
MAIFHLCHHYSVSIVIVFFFLTLVALVSTKINTKSINLEIQYKRRRRRRRRNQRGPVVDIGRACVAGSWERESLDPLRWFWASSQTNSPSIPIGFLFYFFNFPD